MLSGYIDPATEKKVTGEKKIPTRYFSPSERIIQGYTVRYYYPFFRSRAMFRRLLPILVPLLLAVAVTGTYAQRLTVSPRTLVFPCTIRGEVSVRTITLTNNGTSSLRVQRLALSPGSPFIAPNAEFSIPPGKEQQVAIGFAPNVGPREWSDQLRIITPSDQQTVTLIGESSPPPGIGADNTTLDFRDVPELDIAEQCVVLQNPSCTPVEIVEFRLIDPDIRDFNLVNPPPLPYTLRKGEPLRLCVEMLPGAPGRVNGRLDVRVQLVDDPSNAATLQLQLQGMRRQPELRIMPRGINFGPVPVNVISGELEIELTNPGPNPITIPDDWQLAGNDPGEFIIYPPDLPAQLQPRGGNTIRFKVRFAPSSEGPKQAQLRIGPSVADMWGNGTRIGLAGSPLNLDVGEHLVGSSVTLEDTILLRNNGTAPVEITGWDISAAAGRNIFSALGRQSARLEPGEEIRYGITFTPPGVERYTGTLTFLLADGSLLPIRLSGAGVAQERYRFWVDSALADVNTRFDLHLRTSPDLRLAEGVTSYSITLRFAPTALYLHRSTAPDGSENTISYIGEDTVVIRHTGAAPLSGPILATFSFEGLVTGRPSNPVELIEVALAGDTSKGSIRADGLVELRGCDIGYGVGFGRPVVARGAWPAPASDKVTIRYIAPADARPALRVIDLSGREQSRDELPAGTGTEQEATVDLSDLEPGFYILELRSGSGRSSVPVVIAR